MKQVKNSKKITRARRDGGRPGFNAQEAMLLERLGHEAEGAVTRNDDARVFSTLGEALSLASGRAARRKAVPAKKKVATDFAVLSGFELNFACHEYVTSCVNLEKYEEGLAVVTELVNSAALSVSEAATDIAELLARVGRTEEAERVMLAQVEEHPDAVKNYLALGDIYYHWQEQEEYRNFDLAEEWFYRAFDRGLARGMNEESRELLDHLGDACLDRLRAESEADLMRLLEDEGVGDWRTIANLRDSIWHEGAASRLLRHVSRAIAPEGLDNPSSAGRLKILFNFYEHAPQESMGGYSAFERTEILPPGRHEIRIMHDLAEAYAKVTGDRSVNLGAFLSDEFFRFQKTFMEAIDPLTSKRRSLVLNDERLELRNRREESPHPWLGFLRYRCD